MLSFAAVLRYTSLMSNDQRSDSLLSAEFALGLVRGEQRAAVESDAGLCREADTWQAKPVRRVLGHIFDWLANRNDRAQYFCERFWGNWVGMEEGHLWLRAIKPPVEPR